MNGGARDWCPPDPAAGTPVVGQRAHAYGPRVSILDNAFLSSAVARIASPEAAQGELVPLLRTVYTALLVAVLGSEFPRIEAEYPTRMAAVHGVLAHWRGPVLDPGCEVVVCDIIRAGIVPSQVCFELLTQVLPSGQARLDHLNMARRSDAAGRVIGVDLSGSKIGGSVEGRVLLLPDPMGATGATTLRAVDHYLEHHGRPAAILALPMIATPEYLRAVLAHNAGIRVTTARLDRGLSAPDVLHSMPGQRWDEERGLDDHGYIVPGAGGMGEVLNNSWC